MPRQFLCRRDTRTPRSQTISRFSQFGRGHTLDQASEPRDGCSLRGKRLLAFYMAENALRVLQWCFVHFVLRPQTMGALKFSAYGAGLGVTLTNMFGLRFRVSTVIFETKLFTLSGSA